MVHQGSDDLCLGPLCLLEELLGEAVPPLLVRGLDLGKGGVCGVEKGVEVDDVLRSATVSWEAG